MVLPRKKDNQQNQDVATSWKNQSGPKNAPKTFLGASRPQALQAARWLRFFLFSFGGKGPESPRGGLWDSKKVAFWLEAGKWNHLFQGNLG